MIYMNEYNCYIFLYGTFGNWYRCAASDIDTWAVAAMPLLVIGAQQSIQGFKCLN